MVLVSSALLPRLRHTTALIKRSSCLRFSALTLFLGRHSFSRTFAFTSSHTFTHLNSKTFNKTKTTTTTMPAQETYPRFADLRDLHPSLKKAAKKMGYESMTEIQAKTWEAASSGRDVLGRARTGTGKTVSFLLPTIQQLLSQKNKLPADSIQMLVLSPTRELAAQIHDQAEQLAAGVTATITSQVIFGGASKPRDISRFQRRTPTILVATPGRLKDHLETTRLKKGPFTDLLRNTAILVLDETDRLLDMGFRRDVEQIIKYLPDNNKRQTLLFSATVPKEVKQVMAATMRQDFVTVDCIHDKDPHSHTNAQVSQQHVILDSQSQLVTGTVEVLFNIIEKHRQNKDPLKMVVFFNTANLVAYYAALFDALGISVLELHSRKTQSYRTRTADQFRVAAEAILFTSDVSARGVDYPDVNHVVQLGIADSRESYIHRLGRTGRAGKVGQGLLVLTDLEKNFLNKLDGLDVPNCVEMQTLLNNSPGQFVTQKLEPIVASINAGNNKSLATSLRQAYRSMLGFYNGKLGKLGVHGTDRLVEFVNGFAMQGGLSEIPELEMKTVKKMGLVGVRGLNIAPKNSTYSQSRGNNGSGRGGGSGRGNGNTRQGRGSAGGNGPTVAKSSIGDSKLSPQKRHAGVRDNVGTKKPKPDGGQEQGGNGRNKGRSRKGRGGGNAES